MAREHGQNGAPRGQGRMRTGPIFDARLRELSSRSDFAWLAGATTGLALTLVAAFAQLPEGGGRACAYLGLFVRAAIYASSRRTLAGRGGEVLSGLFELGLVAGVFELVVDWWLVNGLSNGALDYMGAPDVVLLSSPIWMPLAWACV